MKNVILRLKGIQMSKVTVEQWKDMFSQVGLSQADMNKWHQIFEQTNPDGHQSFLEWLKPGDNNWIAEVRKESK